VQQSWSVEAKCGLKRSLGTLSQVVASQPAVVWWPSGNCHCFILGHGWPAFARPQFARVATNPSLNFKQCAARSGEIGELLKVRPLSSSSLTFFNFAHFLEISQPQTVWRGPRKRAERVRANGPRRRSGHAMRWRRSGIWRERESGKWQQLAAKCALCAALCCAPPPRLSRAKSCERACCTLA